MLEELEEIKRKKGISLVEQIYETLLEKIVSGTLKNETVLSEVAVAKELDVSRTPVHDALRQLAKDGLVERVAGRRARVAPFTREDVFEIFELRILLEPEAAALAAKRMDLPVLTPLQDSLALLKEELGTPGWKEKWAEHDADFHETIAKESGRKRLAADINRYRLLHRGLNLLGSSEDMSSAVDDHTKILDAIANSDPDRARDEMRAHLKTWQEYFVRTFPS